jgi:hypothetical protein
VPIGNLTSQFFANIHLDGFDHFLKQEMGVKGYVRYVDDFLIFAESREQARAWGRQAKHYLAKLHLEIHPDKYRLCRTDREGADFCGIPREEKRPARRAQARGGLQQQREQPALLEPQQQRPVQREQQRRVPRCQALEGNCLPNGQIMAVGLPPPCRAGFRDQRAVASGGLRACRSNTKRAGGGW